jgi:hypothetical protein
MQPRFSWRLHVPAGDGRLGRARLADKVQHQHPLRNFTIRLAPTKTRSKLQVQQSFRFKVLSTYLKTSWASPIRHFRSQLKYCAKNLLGIQSGNLTCRLPGGLRSGKKFGSQKALRPPAARRKTSGYSSCFFRPPGYLGNPKNLRQRGLERAEIGSISGESKFVRKERAHEIIASLLEGAHK